MIHVEGLSKIFGTVPALDRVSFDVAPGEVVGLLGPNGAGKTTTMRILTGAMAPTTGVVEVAGHDVAKEPLQVKKRVGYLPEVPPLYPEMRVAKYLHFVAELKRVPRSQRHERVEKALAQCWLEDRADQPIEQLSKGYRQRVGLAQAILHEPDLLILDEPTSGLDPRQIIEVRQLIRDLAGEHTVILSSHILSEIAASCQRLIVMNRGRVVATGSVADLAQRFEGGDKIVLQARGDLDALRAAIRSVSGVQQVVILEDPAVPEGWRCEIVGPTKVDIRPQLAAAIVKGGWELIGLSRTELSLEEIFLRLTEGDEEPNEESSQAA